MSELNLHALVREVRDTSTLIGPDAIAAEALRRIPRSRYGEVIAGLLRDYARLVLHEGRDLPAPSLETAGGRPSAVSWKRAGIRAWGRALRQQYHVGGGAWKTLADCTREDLLFLVAERRRTAERTLAKAAKLEALVELLDATGAAVVRDIPADALGRALGDAA